MGQTESGEFEIWSRKYTISQCLIYATVLLIVSLAVTYLYIDPSFIDYKDPFRLLFNCSFIFIFIWQALYWVTVRKMNVVVAPGEIRVFRNSHLYYSSNIDNLRYIVGVDIDNRSSSLAVTKLIFKDKTIVFNIPDSRNMVTKSADALVNLVRCMVITYDLEKKESEESVFYNTCYYVKKIKK